MTRADFLSGRRFYYQGNKAAGGPFHYECIGVPFIAWNDGTVYCTISSVRETHIKCVATVFGRTVRINVRYEDLTPAVPELPLKHGGTQ